MPKNNRKLNHSVIISKKDKETKLPKEMSEFSYFPTFNDPFMTNDEKL